MREVEWRAWGAWAVLALALLVGSAAAQSPLGPPDATIRIATTSVAAGIGVSWGEGTLVFQDEEHSFSVSGLAVADVGVSRVTAVGEVWGLESLARFDGTYYGVDAGVAVGGGGAVLAMRNENGVYIKLRAAQQGVKLSLATKGTTLRLE